MTQPLLATYDIHKSYDWNYENGPVFKGIIPKRKIHSRKIKLFDFEINSPIGVPAGPLLNSNWIKLYAELGWDIPVYKTIRSVKRQCHPNPNCIYVSSHRQLQDSDVGGRIIEVPEEPSSLKEVSITNSFGMPSANPEKWMADIEKANSYLSRGQVMVVSVVGTPGESKNLTEDYAHLAFLAKEAGAKIIEANYSCPNVCSGEGSIFTDPELSGEISEAIRKEIGNTPFMIKVGNFSDINLMEAVAKANAPFVDGIAGINTIPMKVYNEKDEQALPGKSRLTSGICGAAIHDISQKFTENLAAIRKKNKYDFIICGVGGIMTVEDFQERLEGGADIVMSATGAMWDSLMAMEYHNS